MTTRGCPSQVKLNCFQGSQNLEATFVKQKRKLVHKSVFRFVEPLARHVERFDVSSKIEVLGSRFEKSRFLFGVFRGAPLKSESTFVHQRLIMFQKMWSQIFRARIGTSRQKSHYYNHLFSHILSKRECSQYKEEKYPGTLNE
jgi:hypothetical protein